jgi:hypothetical protein
VDEMSVLWFFISCQFLCFFVYSFVIPFSHSSIIERQICTRLLLLYSKIVLFQ